MFGRTEHIHFIGIGGIGMSGIAEVLLNLGFKVSGSDLRHNEITLNLARLGATVYEGHRAEQVEGADVVVTSAAIRPENPEISSAKALQIPVIHRAEMLAELMRLKFGIAVAGTHGKTTTTSLLAVILGQAGFDPTVVVGGRVGSIGSNAKLGHGEYFVTEADESDGSFLLLTPTIAVVTNVDLEHLDHYSGLEQLKRTFLEFINKVPFYGVSVMCLDDENVQALIPSIRKRVVTYGLSKQADFRAEDVRQEGFNTTFNVRHVERGVLGRIHMPLPGRHMVQNALAAVAVSMELNIPFEAVAEAISEFSGVRRRFQRIGQVDDVLIIDDYGHHPTEIRATLAAARSGFGRRLVVAFQPHRYTRTQDLFDDFLTSFNEADKLLVTDIYAASETPIEGVTARKLVDGIRACGHKDVTYVPTNEEVLETLLEIVRPGDLVMTMGAGNLNDVARKLNELLEAKNK
ncbi:MAG TPA: UDP-N-acetylmuramate--L-alanine ligase [bacterium]|nr:UDP-N-acetylmuramate--L-alanine ligase [bacterium]